ncbi:cell division protein FtsZ [Hyphomicrobium sp.]|uniref:cell division protein FtsZ n=1 Tax=Hyphomicrobium sp. TaxID=82 RepID=UPI002D1FA2E7|nr:cell division protein FtsZ [Hyphomicrobium sp.]
MSTKSDLPSISDLRPKLTVIGIGGAGCNAVNNMIASGLAGVDFIVANTDAQALVAAATDLRIQLGAALTEGLGAGSRPEIGEAAAEESIEEIRTYIKGSHMVFIAAGMGGGTGTGAASVIARVAREMGILTVGVVTKPFLFEGARRMRVAEAGIEELRPYVDTLIVIPNQNLFRVASERTTFSEAFVMADQVLYSGVACIVDLILKEGLINLDFADVRTVMTDMGTAMMGTGEAEGQNRATVAAEEAIANPLLDDVSLRGAKGLLLSITGGKDLTLYEVDEAASRVRQEVDPEANIIVGATYDESLGDRIRVSIVASGMNRVAEADRHSQAQPDDWMRGGRAQAEPPPPPPPAAAGHPPATTRDDRAPAPQDMQRRLTEALQYSPSSPSPGAPRPGVPASAGRAPNQSRSGDTWHGPGNVTIESGPPQLQGASPPPLPQQGYAAHGQGGFVPEAPSEIRRQQRRMPDVGDFPPVAQRVYRAMEESRDQPAGHSGEPRRRLGLFERLAGKVRGAPDSDPAHHAEPASYHPSGYADGHSHQNGDVQDYENHSTEENRRGNQDAELPVFFRERGR